MHRNVPQWDRFPSSLSFAPRGLQCWSWRGCPSRWASAPAAGRRRTRWFPWTRLQPGPAPAGSYLHLWQEATDAFLTWAGRRGSPPYSFCASSPSPAGRRRLLGARLLPPVWAAASHLLRKTHGAALPDLTWSAGENSPVCPSVSVDQSKQKNVGNMQRQFKINNNNCG